MDGKMKKNKIFVRSNHSEANDFVRAEVLSLTDVIVKEIDSVESVILEGSFGKGEGSCYMSSSGWVFLSDFDFVVVTRKPFFPPLSIYVSPKLNTLEGIHCNVLRIWRPLLRFVPHRITWYDVKFGSQILYGKEDVLTMIPLHLSDSIPMEEGARLLFNRTLDLLEAFQESGSYMNNEQRLKTIYACKKAILACGECLLLIRKKWSPSVWTRSGLLEKEDFSAEPPTDKLLLSRIQKAVKEATFFKVYVPEKSMNESDISRLWFETQRLFTSFLRYYLKKWMRPEMRRARGDRELVILLATRNSPFSFRDRVLNLLDVLRNPFGKHKNADVGLKNLTWRCLAVAFLLYTAIGRKGSFNISKIQVADSILVGSHLQIERSADESARWRSARKRLFDVANSIRH